MHAQSLSNIFTHPCLVHVPELHHHFLDMRNWQYIYVQVLVQKTIGVSYSSLTRMPNRRLPTAIQLQLQSIYLAIATLLNT